MFAGSVNNFDVDVLCWNIRIYEHHGSLVCSSVLMLVCILKRSIQSGISEKNSACANLSWNQNI